MKKNLVYKIVFIVGIMVILAALFIPAGKDKIIEGYDIANMYRAFTAYEPDGNTAFVQMLFGHSEEVIDIKPLLLSILVLYLPAAFMAAALAAIFYSSESKLGLILGLVGLAMSLGIYLFLVVTGTFCIGVLISMAGVLISLAGILLLFMDADESSGGENRYGSSGKYYEDTVSAGLVMCMEGELSGGTFNIVDRVVIGKNPRECNIVLSNRTVSRVHCILRYIPETGTYTVKDVSTNGTFFANGERLTKNFEMQVAKGTEIYMGEPRESFYLG